MSFNTSFNYSFFVQNAVYNSAPVTRPGVLLTTTQTSTNLKVTVYPTWYKHVAVAWEVPDDWGNCVFNVYTSQTEAGPFQLLTSQPISDVKLFDSTAQEYRKFDRGYYVVEAILLDRRSVSIKSPAASWKPSQRAWVGLRAVEIQRREYWLLSKFNGIKSYLFRKRNFGPRCPECWSYEHETVLKDNCKTCFGTGFEGGYWEANPLYINYEPTSNDNLKTYFGIFEPNQIGAWTISFPEMRPDDIIIRTGDWNIYRVEKLGATELQGNQVRQLLQLSQLAKSDIENVLITKNIPEFPSELQ